MPTGNTGEWWPYAYSPFLQSFGGDLINRTDYKRADGVLNGPEALAWAKWFHSLVTDGYMAAKSGAGRRRGLPQRQERDRLERLLGRRRRPQAVR